MKFISDIINDVKYQEFLPEMKKIFKQSHDSSTELLQSGAELRKQLLDSQFINQFISKNTLFLKNIFIRFFIEKPELFFELDSFKTLNDQFSKRQEVIFPFKPFFKKIIMPALKFNADKPLYDDNVIEYKSEDSEVIYHFEISDSDQYWHRERKLNIQYAEKFIIYNDVRFTNMLMHCNFKNNERTTIDKLKWYYFHIFVNSFNTFKLFKANGLDCDNFKKNLKIKDEFFNIFDQTFDDEIIEKMNDYYDKKTEISRKFSSEFKHFANFHEKVSLLNENGFSLSQLLTGKAGEFFQYFSMIHFPFSTKFGKRYITHHITESESKEDKDLFSVFYKNCIYHYNESFKSHQALFSSMRKKSIYDLIGKETIKNLNYIKTANHDFNPHANYFNCIENNKEAFELFFSENKKLFYPSFSMIGFTGFNQLRSFKNFLKGSSDFKYEFDFEPISKKGWKFLLSQNESYLFRAMKNIRVANIAFNHELKDAWLRSYPLLLCLKNDNFYHGCYDMICRSINEHQGVISKYNPFKKSFPYSYQSKKERLNNISHAFKRFFNDLINKNKCKSNIDNFPAMFSIFTSLLNSTGELIRNENAFILFGEEIKAFKYCDFRIEQYEDDMSYNKQYKKYYNQYKKGNHFFINYDFDFIIKKSNISFIYSKIMPKIKKLTPLLISSFNKTINKYKNKDEFLEFYSKDLILENYHYILKYYNEKELNLQNIVGQIGDYINGKIKNEILPAEKQNWSDVRKYINKYIKDFSHLLELSDRWHREMNERRNAKSELINYSYPDLEDKYKRKNIDILHGTIAFEDFNFTLISNSDLLYEEGKDLHHCVYSYSSLCEKNQYIVFQIDMNNEIQNGKRATLGIKIRNGKYIFDQMFSFSNSKVPPIQHFVANKFLRELNK